MVKFLRILSFLLPQDAILCYLSDPLVNHRKQTDWNVKIMMSKKESSLQFPPGVFWGCKFVQQFQESSDLLSQPTRYQRMIPLMVQKSG